jgi:hypothetical protein
MQDNHELYQELERTEPIRLSVNQKIWLGQMGGRNEQDVEKDLEGGLFVWMYDPESTFKQEKVYLPKY